MPEVFTAEALGRLLGETLESGDRCLLLRAEEGSPDLVRELDRAGRRYRDVPLYRIRPRKILTRAETRLAPQVMIFGSGPGGPGVFPAVYPGSGNPGAVHWTGYGPGCPGSRMQPGGNGGHPFGGRHPGCSGKERKPA